MIRLTIALLITASGFGFAWLRGRISEDPPSVPTERPEAYWRTIREGFLRYPERERVELLFLGDSITDGWDDNPTWRRYYAPRRAAHFGIGGDRTQHLLWRIQNGELSGMNPRVIVVLIGTNNIGSDPPDQIAAGIRKVVAAIRNACPQSRVLVIGVLPRGRSNVRSAQRAPLDPRPAQINSLLSDLDDGENVRVIDVSPAFLVDGEPVKSLMPDFLHLSESGYRALAEAIEPTLASMLTAE
ncbi:MAG: hypothetical protein KatS3mg108_1159 [Isosphaeraceae bacterium]|jgi:lysophospholipase L1-like esterase|nr:MAG: hypothetical protein KatS3mg108_1159 [Isosphaeraceae bacterium]